MPGSTARWSSRRQGNVTYGYRRHPFVRYLVILASIAIAVVLLQEWWPVVVAVVVALAVVLVVAAVVVRARRH